MVRTQKSLVTLTHTDINGGEPVVVICNTVKAGYNKINSANPNANYDGDSPIVRVQTKSITNPIYTIGGVKYNTGLKVIEDEVTYDDAVKVDGVIYNLLTEELAKDLFTLENSDTNPIILNVYYGDGKQMLSLQKYSGSRTADIPVTLNGTLDITLSTDDSKDAYMPLGSIILLETKKI